MTQISDIITTLCEHQSTEYYSSQEHDYIIVSNDVT